MLAHLFLVDISRILAPWKFISSPQITLVVLKRNESANGSVVFPRWVHGLCWFSSLVLDFLCRLSVPKNTHILAQIFRKQKSRGGILPR